jgi:hypothetical protein
MQRRKNGDKVTARGRVFFAPYKKGKSHSLNAHHNTNPPLVASSRQGKAGDTFRKYHRSVAERPSILLVSRWDVFENRRRGWRAGSSDLSHEFLHLHKRDRGIKKAMMRDKKAAKALRRRRRSCARRRRILIKTKDRCSLGPRGNDDEHDDLKRTPERF